MFAARAASDAHSIRTKRSGSPPVLQGILSISLFPLLYLLPVDLQSKETIAVAPFAGEDAHTGELIAARVLTDLDKSQLFSIVERGQLKKALDEISLSASGAVDAKSALEIGRMAGAHYLILGDFMKTGETGAATPGKEEAPPAGNNGNAKADLYTAALRIVQTETGIVVGTSKATGSIEEITRKMAAESIRDLSIYLSLDNPDSPYSVLLKLDRPPGTPYRIDESIHVSFKVLRHDEKAPDRVYIQLYSINAKGIMTLIYPNRFSPGREIQVDQEYSFPPESADFEWVLVPPTGTEYIQAVVTTSPVQLFKLDPKEDFPETKADGKSPVTYRGIKIELSKKKRQDWSAQRISYILEEKGNGTGE